MQVVLSVALIGTVLAVSVQCYGYPGYRSYYSDDDDVNRQLAYQRMMHAQRQQGRRSYHSYDSDDEARQLAEAGDSRQIQQQELAEQLQEQQIPIESAKQEAAAQAAANQAMAQQLMAQQNFAAQQAAARQAAQNVQGAAHQGSVAQLPAQGQRQVRDAAAHQANSNGEQQYARETAKAAEQQQSHPYQQKQAGEAPQTQQAKQRAQQVAKQQALIASHQLASKQGHVNRRRQLFNGQKIKVARQGGLVGANGMHLSNGNYVSYSGQRGIADNEFVFGLKPYIRTDAPMYAIISNSSTTPSITASTAAPVGK